MNMSWFAPMSRGGFCVSQPIKAAVVKAADRVREGEHISVALENTGYFSPLVLQLVQNGEASGKLGEMLERRDLLDLKRAQRDLDNIMIDSRPPVGSLL